jgi:hypothetical protein
VGGVVSRRSCKTAYTIIYVLFNSHSEYRSNGNGNSNSRTRGRGNAVRLVRRCDSCNRSCTRFGRTHSHVIEDCASQCRDRIRCGRGGVGPLYALLRSGHVTSIDRRRLRNYVHTRRRIAACARTGVVRAIVDALRQASCRGAQYGERQTSCHRKGKFHFSMINE